MTNEEFQTSIKLPLEAKILKAKQRVQEAIDQYGVDGVYVSFSGGKDSTALLHLAREVNPNIKAMFIDGLEFPEIRKFVRSIDNVDWVRPKLNFREIIHTRGYPYPSKIQADYVYRYRFTAKTDEAKRRLKYGNPRDDGKATNFRVSEKYWPLLEDDAPLVSEKCCDIEKIQTAQQYQKDHNMIPMLGIMYDESGNRQRDIKKNGCNAFDKKEPQSRPIAMWNEQDVLQYIHDYNVPYCQEYYGDIIYERKTPRARTWVWRTTKYERSGCWGCLFGVDKDKRPNRFEMMKETHPKLWAYCFKDYEDGGLGLNTVCDYMNISYGREESNEDD